MLVIMALALGLVGMTLCALGLRALRPAGTLLTRPTTPIRDVRAGPIEVAGVVRAAEGQPLPSGAGQPCVLVHTLVEKRVGKNNYREVRRDAKAVPAELRDETGCCALSFAHVDLVGEVWEHHGGRDKHRTTQTVVPDGARILVSGQASEVADPGQGSYRQFGQSMSLGGTDDEPLRVAVFGQPGAMWRLGWRGLVVVLCGLGVLALAAAVLWMHLRLEAAIG